MARSLRQEQDISNILERNGNKTGDGKVTVTKKDEGVSWGAMYWQYFEQLDKITPSKTPLSMVKKLFVERNTDAGPVITPVTDKTILKIGDKIKVRIELRVDRDMEYVHMKDMRAAGFEPTNVFSNYKYQDGLGYYESTRDAATNFFFASLPKGTYVFEYPLVVSHSEISAMELRACSVCMHPSSPAIRKGYA